MEPQIAPAQLDTIVASDDISVAQLGGRWLAMVHTVWFILAGLALGLFLLAIPARYLQLSNPPEAVQRSLAELGLSASFYAAYYLAFTLLFAAACFTIAAVIAQRKWNEPMALFTSLFLIFLGALQGQNSTVVEELYPALAFPVRFMFFLLITSYLLFLFTFPDGRFIPRWSRLLGLAWIAWLAIILFASGKSLAEGPGVSGTLMVISGFGAGVAAQIYRYLRVSTPVQRQQTKWVVFGTVASVMGFLGVIIVLPQFLSLSSQPALLYDMAAEAGAILSHLLVPVTISFAILRYRLWEIDLIISRALVYGALTAGVVGTYILIVGGLGTLFQLRSNLFLSLIATGLIAVAFQPFRVKLQRSVSRFMYGERDDPYAVVSRLGQRLEGAVEPFAVLPTVVGTVQEALKLPYVAITLRQEDERTIAASSGTPADESLHLPLNFQGQELGELIVAPRAKGEPLSATDRRLLNDLARQIGVAAHAARLTVDLQRSRERLVTAREEERRRLRRDLHDGLGPQLASQTLKLEVARDLLHSDPARSEKLLNDLIVQSQELIIDIRRLVYALRPPALDELGLLSALQEQLAQYGQTGLKFNFEAPSTLPPLPAAVEVAAYRIAQEAITNVIKHARAQNCYVRLEVKEESILRLEVLDNGCGLPAELRAGVGLTSMRERAEELGGTCIVESSPKGTHVSVQLPYARREGMEWIG